VGWIGVSQWCRVDLSSESTVVGESPDGKNVSLEAPVIVGSHYQATDTQQTENNYVCTVVNYRCSLKQSYDIRLNSQQTPVQEWEHRDK
jgi:hypothetical protein